jgi:transcriptional regulator with PAS, ATPase and Fis domain
MLSGQLPGKHTGGDLLAQERGSLINQRGFLWQPAHTETGIRNRLFSEVNPLAKPDTSAPQRCLSALKTSYTSLQELPTWSQIALVNPDQRWPVATGVNPRWITTRWPSLELPDAAGKTMTGEVGGLREVLGRAVAASTAKGPEALLDGILEALNRDITVLDRTGNIIKTSSCWRNLAREQGDVSSRLVLGVNYREGLQFVLGGDQPLAERAVDAIESVLQGKTDQSSIEYARGPAESPRWFVMRVSALKPGRAGVVIATEEITELKITQDALNEARHELKRLKQELPENHYLRESASMEDNPRMIGQSRPIRQVLSMVDQVAQTDSTVLLMGETGTGKELVANSIHDLSSRRRRSLVSVNCAAMPAPLVESELFGREKGAFTGSLSRQVGRFELAEGSTIFLDEVSELSPEVQAKLLRVLETRQIERLGNPKPIAVNVRIIAATNRDLEQAVSDGKFRQDLYYRLNVFPIRLPALRERREDIPLLVWAFVDEFAKTFNKNVQSIDRESMEALQHYPWPGNVRELRNLIERAMIVATGSKLRIQLPPMFTLSGSANGRKLEEVEHDHILGILEKSGWRIRGVNGAADKLGLKPTTLEARMAKLGIRRPGLAPISQANKRPLASV